MSDAWEVTEDDVLRIARAHAPDTRSDSSLIDEMHSALDMDEVERAVLAHVDFDAQMRAALEEIERQLLEDGYFGSGAPRRFARGA